MSAKSHEAFFLLYKNRKYYQKVKNERNEKCPGTFRYQGIQDTSREDSDQAPPVTGSMTDATSETMFAGNPPFCACSRTIASFGAI